MNLLSEELNLLLYLGDLPRIGADLHREIHSVDGVHQFLVHFRDFVIVESSSFVDFVNHEGLHFQSGYVMYRITIHRIPVPEPST
jgi:hypothetical protein